MKILKGYLWKKLTCFCLCLSRLSFIDGQKLAKIVLVIDTKKKKKLLFSLFLQLNIFLNFNYPCLFISEIIIKCVHPMFAIFMGLA
jgi:hypothetical protein